MDWIYKKKLLLRRCQRRVVVLQAKSLHKRRVVVLEAMSRHDLPAAARETIE